MYIDSWEMSWSDWSEASVSNVECDIKKTYRTKYYDNILYLIRFKIPKNWTLQFEPSSPAFRKANWLNNCRNNHEQSEKTTWPHGHNRWGPNKSPLHKGMATLLLLIVQGLGDDDVASDFAPVRFRGGKKNINHKSSLDPWVSWCQPEGCK